MNPKIKEIYNQVKLEYPTPLYEGKEGNPISLQMLSHLNFILKETLLRTYKKYNMLYKLEETNKQ